MNKQRIVSPTFRPGFRVRHRTLYRGAARRVPVKHGVRGRYIGAPASLQHKRENEGVNPESTKIKKRG